MGQGYSISNSKVYIENSAPQLSSTPLNGENSKSFDKEKETILPITSFKNKLRVYQNFETSEVLVLLDSDINEFPGFSKSEAEEWYEVRLSHLQLKYFDHFKVSNTSKVFHQQGKKFTTPPAPTTKEKDQPNHQTMTSLNLNLTHDREKVESVPPFQHSSREGLGFSTQTISSLLTPHNDSFPSEPKDGGPCPFCKEFIVGDDGFKHVCDCANSEKIQERFVESDNLLQSVP